MPDVILYLCRTKKPIDRPRSRELRDRAAALCFRSAPYAFWEPELGKKPELLLPEGAQFNVSHTRDLFVCAFSTVPIGVDAEYLRPIKRKDEIAKRFFSASAQERLFAAPKEESDRLFLECWTHLEARAKFTGNGVFRQKSERPEENELCLTDLDAYLPEGFVGTLCTEAPPAITAIPFPEPEESIDENLPG